MTNPHPAQDTGHESMPLGRPQNLSHPRKTANIAAIGPAIVAYFFARELLTRVLGAVEAKPRADKQRKH